MSPLSVIESFYPPGTRAHEIMVTHGNRVTEKALETARRVPELSPDLDFIREAAMLHDIGIFLTLAPEIGCTGDKPYICHGYLGRALLEEKGLPRHAMVAERHTGVGLTREDIEKQALPVPGRDMVPISIEEKIICYADKFFSKSPGKLDHEKSPGSVLDGMARFGKEKADTFSSWMTLFKENG